MRRLTALFVLSCSFVLNSAWASSIEFDDTGKPRTVVIFAGSYGGGHDTSAFAQKAELLAAHPNLNVVILFAQDYMYWSDRFPAISKASIDLFNLIYQKAPKLYNFIYDRTMDTAEGKTSAADIPNPSFSKRRIMEDLERIQPDVILSTYHIITSKLIWLRERGVLNPKIPIAWLDTDFVHRRFYYLHSFGVDMTFMAHPELEAERVRLGVPPEKMATTGLNINKWVFKPFSSEERREFLEGAMNIPDRAAESNPEIWINGGLERPGVATKQLDPEFMTVTIASGRAGVGDYKTIIAGLVREARARGRKIQIITVCGDNKKNYEAVTGWWRKEFGDAAPSDVKLVVSRLVDNDKLMKLVHSSDMFIGKSGSQSPFEAAVMGVPRILIDIIGGQERVTANFFRERGLAEVVKAHEQDQLARRAFEFVEDEPRMAKMRAADQVIRDSYSDSPLLRFVERSIEARPVHPVVRLRKRFRFVRQGSRFHGFCEKYLSGYLPERRTS